MKKTLIWFIILIRMSVVNAQITRSHGRLILSPERHYLQYADGTPFFWLGDTGWELFHRLTLQEIRAYLDNRAAKGFTVIQAVALAEFDGLRLPNRYGQVPFRDLDPEKPNDAYFAIIDSTIRMAARRGLFIGLLPTWGDKVTRLWGTGPVIFDSINAYRYGRWIGNRYKDAENVIYILGGDRPALTDSVDWRPVWRQMARGIIQAAGRRCLIAYHPWGGPNSTSQWLQNEAWLDVNMFQSGHGGGHDVACWSLVKRDRAMTPAKPTLDAEPNYEDHPVNPWPKWSPDNGYFRAYDVRKQLYRSVFAGACGVTYGHHAVWQFMSAREEVINYADRGWINAMDRPGAFQAGYLRRLIESRPMRDRRPDSILVVGGLGEAAQHVEAFTGADSSYAMIYLPVGRPVTICLRELRGKDFRGWWFNPRDATVQVAVSLPADGGKEFLRFDPPTLGSENDWVLVIDDAACHYRRPGQPEPLAAR